MHYGLRDIESLLTFRINTHTPSTGVETDADAAPTYRVYEEETGTSIATGSMALLDDANTVGYYSEQIALAASTGFERGKDYGIRIRAVVGGAAGALDLGFRINPDVIDRGVLQDADTAEATLKAASNFADDLLRGCVLEILTGTGINQSRVIAGNVQSTDVVQLEEAWAVVPVTGDEYRIVLAPAAPTFIPADVQNWRGVLPNALASGLVPSNIGAINGDTTAAVRLALGALGVASFTVQSGSTASAVITDLVSTAGSYWAKSTSPTTMILLTGALAGQWDHKR